jgi:predicted ATPase
MLTRLRVKGFKNLRDVDVRFGYFTCVAGANGVGKSNLFDAIVLLSDLASMPIMKAFSQARGTNGRTADFEALFYREAAPTTPRIEFIAEMIVPREVLDDFDRKATPTASFVEYTVVLRLNLDSAGLASKDSIHIEKEELRAISSSDAGKSLEFSGGTALARDKKFVFGPGKRTTPFIQTSTEGDEPVIRLFGEQGLDGKRRGGRALEVRARKSPQSVLSGVNLISHPTALAARREMQSWRLLQLEPSALRMPDQLSDEDQISATGQHVPNTLFRLGGYGDIANRLSELVPGVRSLEVQEDAVRQLRTLSVTMGDSRSYSASSLSDGTLRFLALAVLANDPNADGLVCMEEPENGIHPLRIPEMLQLVRSLSDADVADGSDTQRESLRQVIINTHSPLVVAEILDEELLMAETLQLKGASFVNFKSLRGTWRTGGDAAQAGIARGELNSYLSGQSPRPRTPGKTKVRDHFGSRDLFQTP